MGRPAKQTEAEKLFKQNARQGNADAALELYRNYQGEMRASTVRDAVKGALEARKDADTTAVAIFNAIYCPAERVLDEVLPYDRGEDDAWQMLRAGVDARNMGLVSAYLASGLSIDGFSFFQLDAVAAGVRTGRQDIVEALVRAGADVNGENGGALTAAVKAKDSAMVKLLLSHGADPCAGGYQPLMQSIGEVSSTGESFFSMLADGMKAQGRAPSARKLMDALSIATSHGDARAIDAIGACVAPEQMRSLLPRALRYALGTVTENPFNVDNNSRDFDAACPRLLAFAKSGGPLAARTLFRDALVIACDEGLVKADFARSILRLGVLNADDLSYVKDRIKALASERPALQEAVTLVESAHRAARMLETKATSPATTPTTKARQRGLAAAGRI